MKVLHVLLSPAATYGGPPAVVRDLSEELGELGVTSVVVTLGTSKSATTEFPDNVKVIACRAALDSKLGLPLGSDLVNTLLEESKQVDLVHLHDIWHFPQLAAAVISRLRTTPYIVTPHGALEPWCLKQHRLLKSLAWFGYQKRVLGVARGVHALTHQEESTIRQLGLKVPTAVIPSGVDLEAIDMYLHELPVDGEGAGESGAPFILYVGRLDRKKRLDLLIDTFAQLAGAHRTLALLIAGPDPSGLRHELRNHASQMGLEGRVRFIGFVSERLKFQLLSRAELFVQPSYSEGLSVAVLESMACGTPVVVSKGCNIPEVAESAAGFCVDDKPSEISKAITVLLENPELRSSMARNARLLIEAKFTASRMAKAMKEFYRRSLDATGAEAKPAL